MFVPNMERMRAEIQRNLPEHERGDFKDAYTAQEKLIDAIRRQIGLEYRSLRQFLEEHYATLVPDEKVPDPTLVYMVQQVRKGGKENNKELYGEWRARERCIRGLRSQEAIGRHRLRTFLQERYDRLVSEAQRAS